MRRENHSGEAKALAISSSEKRRDIASNPLICMEKGGKGRFQVRRLYIKQRELGMLTPGRNQYFPNTETGLRLEYGSPEIKGGRGAGNVKKC